MNIPDYFTCTCEEPVPQLLGPEQLATGLCGNPAEGAGCGRIFDVSVYETYLRGKAGIIDKDGDVLVAEIEEILNEEAAAHV